MTRVLHAGARSPRRDSRMAADIDLIRELSEIAKTTRRPGQTLQSRLNELRREVWA